MFSRDLLRAKIGERLLVRLSDGVQLSGVLWRVTRGELELTSVRVLAGDSWQQAATGSVGVERAKLSYWQHVVTVVEQTAVTT